MHEYSSGSKAPNAMYKQPWEEEHKTEADISPDKVELPEKSGDKLDPPYEGGTKNPDVSKSQHKYDIPSQVLGTNSPFGMECYGTTLLIILKSYGLVPPEMTREEFEKKYTPVNASDSNNATEKYLAGLDVFTYRYTQLKDNEYRMGSYTEPMIAASRALRGFENIPGVIKKDSDLQWYLNAFSVMKSRKDKTPVKKYEVNDLTKKIDEKKQIGQLDESKVRSHLQGGDTIYVGVSLSGDFFHDITKGPNYSQSMDHRVVLTDYIETLHFKQNNSEVAETVDVYLADDPLRQGKVIVLQHQLPTGSGVTVFGNGVGETWLDNYVLAKGVTNHYLFSRDAFAAKMTETK
jgi:hypothetical protein